VAFTVARREARMRRGWLWSSCSPRRFWRKAGRPEFRRSRRVRIRTSRHSRSPSAHGGIYLPPRNHELPLVNGLCAVRTEPVDPLEKAGVAT